MVKQEENRNIPLPDNERSQENLQRNIFQAPPDPNEEEQVCNEKVDGKLVYFRMKS